MIKAIKINKVNEANEATKTKTTKIKKRVDLGIRMSTIIFTIKEFYKERASI